MTRKAIIAKKQTRIMASSVTVIADSSSTVVTSKLSYTPESSMFSFNLLSDTVVEAAITSPSKCPSPLEFNLNLSVSVIALFKVVVDAPALKNFNSSSIHNAPLTNDELSALP